MHQNSRFKYKPVNPILCFDPLLSCDCKYEFYKLCACCGSKVDDQQDECLICGAPAGLTTLMIHHKKLC